MDKIKVIAIEDNDNEIYYFKESSSEYIECAITRDNKIRGNLNVFKKNKFSGLRHFSGVMGKFRPYLPFLKTPKLIEEDFVTLKKTRAEM